MTTAFDKWFEDFYKDWDYSKERLTLQDKLRYAYLAGRDSMRKDALECCDMYAMICGCSDNISAEIMRCQK